MEFKYKLKEIMELPREERLDSMCDWIEDNPEESTRLTPDEIGILGVVLDQEDYDEVMNKIMDIEICRESHEPVTEPSKGTSFIRVTIHRYFGSIPEVEITMN